jgi:pyruvate/oxaloacetate carboxyltransferase
VSVHSHDTAGLAGAAYLAATDAGALAVETSIAPFANGTAQPDTVRMLALLEGNPRCPKHFNADLLQEIRVALEAVYAQLSAFTSPANERTDPDILTFQIPGGMLSNFRNQLKDLKMEDKTAEVMAEVPVVREALGWIPLVTPTSQIVGTQAMLNVKFGRWKNFAPAAMDIALGKYGTTPGPINPEVRDLAIKLSKQDLVDCRPADLLEPRMEKLRTEVAAAGLPATDEVCVLYAMFPQQATAWYKGERPEPPPAPKPKAEAASSGPRKLKITIGNRSQEALVEEVA